MKSPVIKRSIMLAGHKTSVSLEDAFWECLKEIAHNRKMSGSALIGTIDGERAGGSLSSAIRLFVLSHYRAQAAPQLDRRDARQDAMTGREADIATPTYRGSEAARPPGFRRWA